MAATYQIYAGDGTNRNFGVPFPYLARDHVKVRINSVQTLAFSWLNDAMIQLTPAPAAGAIVDVRRVTPSGAPPVDFENGSVLADTELDLVSVYSSYLSEEARDFASDSLRADYLGSLDARAMKVVNVAPGVSPGDAVNKGQMDAIFTSDVSALTALKNATTDQANAASASAASASGSAASAASNSVSAVAAAINAIAARDATATMRDSFLAVTGGYGYLPPVNYSAGLPMTQVTQTVQYAGATYAPLLSALPFTTGGSFDPSKWRLIQGVATADLAATAGSGLVGFDGGTVQDVLDAIKPLAGYTTLRAYTGRATGVQLTSSGVAGLFQRDPSDTTTADNGGTVIVDGSGRRWKRVFSGAVSLLWFGATEGGVYTTNTPLKRALVFAVANNLPLDINASITVGESITVTGGRVVLTGAGKITQSTAGLLVLDDCEYLSVGPGVTFDSTLIGVAAPAIAVRGKSVRRVDFDATVGNVLIVLRGDGTSGQPGKQANVKAKFVGDYTGAGSGDIANILDVRQYGVLDFSGSSFAVQGSERMIKTCDMGTLRGRGFSMSGSCQKQIIDAYNDTRNVYLDRYTVDVSGCTGFFEQKQANMATSFPENIYLGAGSVRLTSTGAAVNVVLVQGAWGLPSEPANYECKVHLSGLRATVDAANNTQPLVSIRGVTDYSDENCQVLRTNVPAVVFAGISIRNTRRAVSVNMDCVGAIECADGANTTDGVAYTKGSDTFEVVAPNIRDYNANGGVWCHAVTALALLSVKGGTIKSSAGRASVLESIYLASATIGHLHISGVSTSAGTGLAGYRNVAGVTIGKRYVRGNDWQFGTFSWTPGAVLAGNSVTSPNVTPATVLPGDPIHFAEPYDLQGMGKSMFVTGGSVGRCILQNPTGGTVNLAAGTWAYETWKQ